MNPESRPTPRSACADLEEATTAKSSWSRKADYEDAGTAELDVVDFESGTEEIGVDRVDMRRAAWRSRSILSRCFGSELLAVDVLESEEARGAVVTKRATENPRLSSDRVIE